MGIKRGYSLVGKFFDSKTVELVDYLWSQRKRMI